MTFVETSIQMVNHSKILWKFLSKNHTTTLAHFFVFTINPSLYKSTRSEKCFTLIVVNSGNRIIIKKVKDFKKSMDEMYQNFFLLLITIPF